MAIYAHKSVIQRLARVWVFVALIALAVPVHGQTQAWAAFLPSAEIVGKGEFRYWGFRVYDASLWSPKGTYEPGAPFALSLQYARDLSASSIVDSSLDEMRKLGQPVESNPQWEADLLQAMADISRGDTLTGVYTPGKGAVFFHNDQLTGQINETLAQAFFAIWLDERTRAPNLRQALLGVDK
jgi:hypothetical protein